MHHCASVPGKVNPPGGGRAGQTVLEFVLLMAVIMTLSLTFLFGFRSGVKTFWTAAAKIVAHPSDSMGEIEL